MAPSRPLWGLLLLLLLLPPPLAARDVWQDFHDYLHQPAQWQQGEWLTLGGIALLTATALQYDEAVRDGYASNQGPTGDLLARVGNGWGELQDLGGLTLLSLYWSGRVSGDEGLKRLATDGLEAVVLSGATTAAGKWLLGRLRPSESPSAQQWGQGGQSFPSGHTTMAFALSTVLAESSPHPSLGRRLFFYSLAGLTASARIYDQRHWLSDTVAGAAIGINAGLFVVHRSHPAGAAQTYIFLVPNGIQFVRPL